MTEKEKEILDNLKETLPKLSDVQKNFLLGFAKGMAHTRKSSKAS